MFARRGSPLKLAIVGATGMVGKVLLEVLERRRFPVEKLLPFSSGRRKASVRFRGRSIPAPGVDIKTLRSADLTIFVSADSVSKKYARGLAARGAYVIDDSAAFRMEKDVPLVIPEVNADALRPNRRLIAGPNCTVTGLAVAGYPLHKRARAKTVRVASYQAVSGAGRDALLEFYAQTRKNARAMNGDLLPKFPKNRAAAFPEPIGLNILPHVGSFNKRGDTGEEIKVRNELRKLWRAPNLSVSATTVRVPVVRGHSLAVWMEMRKQLTPSSAARTLSSAPGVRVWKGARYPTVHKTYESGPVHVGRIRSTGVPRELQMWIVSDNLLKGAALNSVHIAEFLLKKRWLSR
ncbi:MAG: aspartate-semialdehyde dehydrogenase [Elusimicrobiota bacterium]